MARRKSNPINDIDDIVDGSGAIIDTIYAEHAELLNENLHLEDIKNNLEKNNQSIPSEVRKTLIENKLRIKFLESRIARHEMLMVKRLNERLSIIENSPGSSFSKRQINEVHKAIFNLEKKIKSGDDVRNDIAKIFGAIITLERDSNIIIQKQSDKEATVTGKETEPQLLALLAKNWQKVYKHAKNDPRVKDDIDWIETQIRSLAVKLKRGDSIRRGVERVQYRITDVFNRTKPRKRLKTYSDSRSGINDFVQAVKSYASKSPTSAGIDRLEYELEEFAREFTPKSKADWSPDERRQFNRDISNIRKSLEMIRPKRGRKNNPCVGLHFHGKDSDDLMKALESSAARTSGNAKATKSNPSNNAKDLIDECRSIWELYSIKPTKKNFKAVLAHLEIMKNSKNDNVKKERARCAAAARRESKRIGA